jgi:hypothetical protein
MDEGFQHGVKDRWHLKGLGISSVNSDLFYHFSLLIPFSNLFKDSPYFDSSQKSA